LKYTNGYSLTVEALIHDLGWIGLELTTLTHWAAPSADEPKSKLDKDHFTSDRWLFLGMEL